MNLKQHLQTYIAAKEQELSELRFAADSLDVEIDDKSSVNPAGGSLWINVYNRDDFMKVIAVCKSQWTKRTSPYEGALEYENMLGTLPVAIHAHEGALPPTCRLIEETVEIPAQPAKTITRKILKCDAPKEEVTA